MDTSRARQAIFERIRQAKRNSGGTADMALDYLARHPAGPQPRLGPDLQMHFLQQALRMADTVGQLASLDQVPVTVSRYLETHGLQKSAVAWKTLTGLAWQQAGIEVQFRPPHQHDLVGITGCFCAIAETGSLLLLSGSDTWASTGLLPETHIAIVPGSRIVPTMEDAFALVRAERGELPRAANFISGPSRTGDIEQTIVVGAHGPYRVHVIVVQDATAK